MHSGAMSPFFVGMALNDIRDIAEKSPSDAISELQRLWNYIENHNEISDSKKNEYYASLQELKRQYTERLL
jgi:hypothetical protein